MQYGNGNAVLIGHILRHNGLLHKIIEGILRGKPTTWRKRLQMLNNLTKADCYAALKRAAEESKGSRRTCMVWETCCTKPAVQQKKEKANALWIYRKQYDPAIEEFMTGMWHNCCQNYRYQTLGVGVVMAAAEKTEQRCTKTTDQFK